MWLEDDKRVVLFSLCADIFYPYTLSLMCLISTSKPQCFLISSSIHPYINPYYSQIILILVYALFKLLFLSLDTCQSLFQIHQTLSYHALDKNKTFKVSNQWSKYKYKRKLSSTYSGETCASIRIVIILISILVFHWTLVSEWLVATWLAISMVWTHASRFGWISHVTKGHRLVVTALHMAIGSLWTSARIVLWLSHLWDVGVGILYTKHGGYSITTLLHPDVALVHIALIAGRHSRQVINFGLRHGWLWTGWWFLSQWWSLLWL